MMEKVEILIQIQDLCNTIYEGVVYFAEHPETVSMITDISSGIDALTLQLTAEKAMENDVQKTCKRLRQDLSTVKSAESIQLADQLVRKVSVAISKKLSSLLNSDTYISRETAKKIFNFYDSVPHEDVSIIQLVFDTCAKSSLSAPKEAFEYTLKLFAEQPGMLSGENTPHPGYVYQPSEQRTFECCPICGGEGTPYYRSMAYFMGDFRAPHLPVKLWMKCGKCKDLYTWKYSEDFLKLSDHEQWVYPDLNQQFTATGNTDGGSLALWSDILNKLRACSSGNTLLEVGIGRGELLAVALELGLEVDAVEIVLGAAQKIANVLNLPIWAGDFLNYAPGKTYSIITMGDVIEHVINPELALRNAYRLLEDDGVLWLSTPNYRSSFSRMMKFSDPMWMEPYHISYFSKSGLERLAAKCGFGVHEYSVSRRYNGSMELILKKQ